MFLAVAKFAKRVIQNQLAKNRKKNTRCARLKRRVLRRK